MSSDKTCPRYNLTKNTINEAVDKGIPIGEALRNIDKNPRHKKPASENQSDTQDPKPTNATGPNPNDNLLEVLDKLREEVRELKETIIPKIQQEVEEFKAFNQSTIAQIQADTTYLKEEVTKILAKI